MKKMLKKVFAFVLAFALFASLGVVREAKADDYTAFLMFSDRNWAFGNWDANLASATTPVSLDGGPYKVTLNA
ncbi:MAG: hypothetical protein J6U42_04015, partial [Lachnospiraceae bacterium]|nr:hypothetical protein [Lachnospiraceae bacterium]